MRLVDSGLAQRRAVGLMLALALLVRLLVPTGWMPTVDAGGLHLTWCGSAGPPPPAFQKAIADTAERLGLDRGQHREGHPGGHDKPGGDQPCSFAGLAFAALDPVAPALAAPPEVASPAAPRAGIVAIGRGLAAPPPPSTGPPVLI